VFWFWLWTGLVVAWLTAVVISVIWLWRLIKQFMAAGSTAAAAMERLEQTGNFAATTPAPVAIDAPAEDLLAIRRAMRTRRQARRDRRRTAHQATYRRWAVLAGWQDQAR